MKTKFKIGITEYGDPGEDFSWIDYLKAVEFAVVISKAANEQFEDMLLKNKDRIIYHATCTGLGGTAIEDGVPTSTEKFQHLKRLLDRGFPAKQIVLRVDPLFPLSWVPVLNKVFQIDYPQKLMNILTMTESFGIKRVRYSYLDVYKFSLKKLQKISKDFILPKDWMPVYENELQLDKVKPDLEYEACNELYVPKEHKIPCISEKDLKIMGLDKTHKLDFPKANKAMQICGCPSNKLELMLGRELRCNFDCKYCYWKDDRAVL